MPNSVNTNNYSNYTNPTNKTSTKGSTVDAWFEDPNKNDISVDSFLQLMIAQLKNQDFNNPVDDTQYVTQLAQFATMQSMQELSYYSKANYVNSLLGKEISASKLSLGGNMSTVTGTVSKISLIDGQFTVFIGEEMFKMDQIMEVKQPVIPVEETDEASAVKKSDQSKEDVDKNKEVDENKGSII